MNEEEKGRGVSILCYVLHAVKFDPPYQAIKVDIPIYTHYLPPPKRSPTHQNVLNFRTINPNTNLSNNDAILLKNRISHPIFIERTPTSSLPAISLKSQTIQ